MDRRKPQSGAETPESEGSTFRQLEGMKMQKERIEEMAEKDGMKYYLAYGSNLDLGQMEYRCPDAVKVGTASLPGYRLMFKGSLTGGYLTVESDAEKDVPLGVFQITPEDEENLDMYESFPRFYYKKNFRVALKKDSGGTETVTGMIYIMDERRKLAMPDQRYIMTCKRGYHDFGFNTEYIDDALRYTVLTMSGYSDIYKRRY